MCICSTSKMLLWYGRWCCAFSWPQIDHSVVLSLIIKTTIGSNMADTIAGCSLNTNTILRLRVIITEPTLL
jgi:hypothetical protein